jgi:hypothetical protein
VPAARLGLADLDADVAAANSVSSPGGRRMLREAETKLCFSSPAAVSRVSGRPSESAALVGSSTPGLRCGSSSTALARSAMGPDTRYGAAEVEESRGPRAAPIDARTQMT